MGKRKGGRGKGGKQKQKQAAVKRRSSLLSGIAKNTTSNKQQRKQNKKNRRSSKGVDVIGHILSFNKKNGGVKSPGNRRHHQQHSDEQLDFQRTMESLVERSRAEEMKIQQQRQRRRSSQQKKQQSISGVRDQQHLQQSAGGLQFKPASFSVEKSTNQLMEETIHEMEHGNVLKFDDSGNKASYTSSNVFGSYSATNSKNRNPTSLAQAAAAILANNPSTMRSAAVPESTTATPVMSNMSFLPRNSSNIPPTANTLLPVINDYNEDGANDNTMNNSNTKNRRKRGDNLANPFLALGTGDSDDDEDENVGGSVKDCRSSLSIQNPSKLGANPMMFSSSSSLASSVPPLLQRRPSSMIRFTPASFSVNKPSSLADTAAIRGRCSPPNHLGRQNNTLAAATRAPPPTPAAGIPNYLPAPSVGGRVHGSIENSGSKLMMNNSQQQEQQLSSLLLTSNRYSESIESVTNEEEDDPDL